MNTLLGLGIFFKILVNSLYLNENGSIVSFKSDVRTYLGVSNDDKI